MLRRAQFSIVDLLLASIGAMVIHSTGLHFFTVFPFTWSFYPYWSIGISVLLLLPYLVWRGLRYVKWNDTTPLQSTNKSIMGVVILIYLVSVGITAYGVRWLDTDLHARALIQFENKAERISAEVNRRFNQPIYGLKGARGAFAAHGGLTRQGFKNYMSTRDLANEFPGVRGFGFIERVTKDDVALFTSREQHDNAPLYTIKSNTPYDDLFVIKYIEPLEPNIEALGYDIGQELSRRHAAELAATTGNPTLTSPVTLVQDGQKRPGFLYLVPTYQEGIKPLLPDGTPAKFIGWFYAPMVADDLLRGLLDTVDATLDFELHHVGGENTFIYDANHATRLESSIFESHKSLNIGGEPFEILVHSTRAFENTLNTSSIPLAVFGGILASNAISFCVWLLLVGNARTRRLAQTMTQDLDRLARVVKHTENAVTINDRQMRITWVNEGFTRLTGYTLEEAYGKTPGELVGSGDNESQVIEQLAQAVEQGVACKAIVRNRSKDGRIYWFSTEVQPTFDERGVVNGFMEIGSDITQQKEAQLALNDLSERMSLATDSAGIGIWEWDLQTNTLTWDCQMYQLYGHQELLNDLPYEIWSRRVLPEDLPAAEFEMSRAIQTGTPYEVQFRILRLDDKVRNIRAVGRSVRNDKGATIKMVGVNFDVTETVQAQEALVLSEEFLERTGRIAGVGGWNYHWNPERIELSNETRILYEFPFGYNPSVSDFLSCYMVEDQAKIIDAFKTAQHIGSGWDFELPFMTHAGTKRWVRIVGEVEWQELTPVSVIGSIQDISVRKQIELDLQESKLKAENANIAKGQFLANMSHEIRTPMNAILGMLHLLQQTGLTKQQTDYSSKATIATKSLLSIINDILDFSKIEAGKLTLDPREFIIDGLLNEIAPIISAYVGGKRIEVLFNVDPELRHVFIGDDLRLRQILINLIGNAIKFTEHGACSG